MNIPGLPDILISRAKLEAQCERYGHDWLNQIGFGVFCRRCGAAPSNPGVQPTAELPGLESFVDKSKEERQPAAADA